MKIETLTAARLAKRVKVGDKMWVELEVSQIDIDDPSVIQLKVEKTENMYGWMDKYETLTILTPEPEVRTPQVGDVYEYRPDPLFRHVNETVSSGMKIQIVDLNFDEKGYLRTKIIYDVGDNYISQGIKWFILESLKHWKFLYNINDLAKETAQELKYPEKLEAGQYWHHPVTGSEIVILEGFKLQFTKSGYWVDKDGDFGKYWKVSEITSLVYNLQKLIDRGYLPGKHPENIADTYPDGKEWKTIRECKPRVGDLVEWKHTSGIELNKITNIRNNVVCTTFVSGDVSSHTDTENEQEHEDLSTDNKAYRIYRRATPSTWHPKEGDLVWCPTIKEKGRATKNTDTDDIIIWTWDSSGEMSLYTLNDVQPYTGQDKPKIDFSEAGQWITDGEFVVKTTGDLRSGNQFWAKGIGTGDQTTNYSVDHNWQPCTPEQIELINNLITTLK